MMTCNMVTNMASIFRKVITSAAQMDFSMELIFIVVLQDFIGHFAPLALEFGVSHNRRGNSVALKMRVFNYFVNASRGWMMTCNMVTDSFATV